MHVFISACFFLFYMIQAGNPIYKNPKVKYQNPMYENQQWANESHSMFHLDHIMSLPCLHEHLPCLQRMLLWLNNELFKKNLNNFIFCIAGSKSSLQAGYFDLWKPYIRAEAVILLNRLRWNRDLRTAIEVTCMTCSKEIIKESNPCKQNSGPFVEVFNKISCVLKGDVWVFSVF